MKGEYRLRIQKVSDAEDGTLIKRKLANIGCNVCPCCGEKRKFSVNLFTGKPYGILKSYFVRSESHTFSNRKEARYDMYSCTSCGAKWESDAY
jgi:hypothetical protein